MRWLVLVVVLAAGCYSPSYRDCQFECADNQCPSGLECTGGMCRRPGMTGPCAVDPTIDAPDHDAPPAAIPFDMLADAQRSAFCARLVRCGVQDNMTSCLQIYGAFTSNYLQDIGAAIAAGKVTYHPDRAAACIDYTENLACDRDARFALSNINCSTTFEGTGTSGQTCAIGAECVSQSCNVNGNCGMACCTGTCVGDTAPTTKSMGQACTTMDICSGGYCNAAGICATYAVDGDTCGNDVRCGPGLACRVTGTLSMCRPLVATNGACSATDDCKNVSDLCVASVCKTNGLVGTQCQSASECQELHQCVGASGLCALPPSLGESCANYQFCQSGYCNLFNTMCEPKKADGVACDPNGAGRDCASGYCDTTVPNPVCAPDPICI